MAPKTPVWPLEPHTKAKHDLLKQYLGAWFPILSWNGRVVFLDGFAGPGIYSGGEQGSPIIALETLLDHPRFPFWKTEFVFIFMEPKKKRFEILQDVLNEFKKNRGGLPPNVKASAGDVSFVEGAGSILETLEAQKAKLAPTFAFIDPFGWSDSPLDLIARLLAFPRCEVFFNFMFDHINRFIEDPKQLDHMTGLFGTNDFLQAGALAGAPRKQFLHDLYQRQLETACKFEYVRSFEMISANGHTGYF